MTIPIILPDGSLGEAETRGSGMPAAELIALLQDQAACKDAQIESLKLLTARHEATIRRLREERWTAYLLRICRCSDCVRQNASDRAKYDAETERLCRGESP